MSNLSGLRRLIRFPWRSHARIRRDIDDEFQFHLEMRIDELRARGIPPETARAEALRRFGDVRDATEYCRTMDERSVHEHTRRNWFAELGSDVQYALRQMRRSRAFTALSVVTLGLGIGATTAIFSVVNRLVLNPIPYADGERFVNLNRSNMEGNLYVTPTPKLVDAWRKNVRSLEEIATFGWEEVVVAGRDEPEELGAGTLSANLLRMLGVKPVLGRGVLIDDTKPGAPKVVMLGYGYWQRRFAGSRDVLGDVLSINGAPHTIVGVLPRDFTVPFLDGGSRPLWLPLIDDPAAMGAQAFARMRAGVDRAQVDRELTDVVKALGVEEPAFKEWKGIALRPQDYLGSTTKDTLLLLVGAVMMVLLIACANVANLLLARAATRDREFAIRAALGAGRWRIIRQLLTESLLLAVAGGALGVWVAQRGLKVIVALRPERLAELDEVRLSPVVLLVSLGVTLFTGILFGLAPALFAAARDIGNALKSGTRAAGNRGARRFRSFLVVAEVSLSVLLLIGAGLLIRTMVKMQHADVGFEAAGLMSARVQLPEGKYPERAQRRAAFDQIMERVNTIPGVTEITWAVGVPPRTGISFGKLELADRVLPPNEQVSVVGSQFPMPDYFKVMRLPLAAGRVFSTDTTAREVMINEGMAKRYWPTSSAVGRRIRLNTDAGWLNVVGVVRDITIPSTGKKSGATSLQVYFPFAREFESATVIVRTSGAATDFTRRLTREVTAFDPGARVRDVSSVEALLSNELAGPRFTMSLLATFAGLALVLATIGLYGVIAYSVSQRTREMGIRLALGADRPSVLRLVMSQGARLTLVGLIAGLAGAAALTRVMVGMLFGVTPLDPITFGVVGVVLAMVALFASYFPARRATRVDPVVALRTE